VSEDPIEAVVFDFDGVVANSIQVHAVAYQLTLKPLGVPVETHQVYLREGARSETIIRTFLEEAGRDPDDELVDRLTTIKQRVFERVGEPGLYPWARQVVETVDDRGFAMAICTGTRRENVPGIAGDLAKRFDFVASEETYTRDKPHPEAFATAAEGLGIEPERCLAIENAPRGIESASTAGMPVVGVATTLTREEVAEADLVLDRVEDVLDVLPKKAGGTLRL
jgi:HAD superfamily hydrolase (TIGR01509 family)